MNLFPKTIEFIYEKLIQDENNITPFANGLHNILSKRFSFFRDNLYEELLQAFNNYFMSMTNEGEVDENNFDEIDSLINEGELFFRDGIIERLGVSNYDVCALLLIIKKINEVGPDNVQNAEHFLNETVNSLDNQITDEKVRNNDSLIDFLSYENIQNDLVIIFTLRDDINHPALHELIDGKYSYLFLNKMFKQYTYENLNLENIQIISPNSKFFNQFKEDLLRYNTKALTYDEWSTNRETVLKAVKNHGVSLKYATDELKKDKEIVLEAVKNHGDSLEYAAKYLKSDRQVVYSAVSNTSSSLKFASNNILADVLLAIRGNNF